MTDFQLLIIVLSLFSLNIDICICTSAIAHAIKDLKKKEDKNNGKEENIKFMLVFQHLLHIYMQKEYQRIEVEVNE